MASRIVTRAGKEAPKYVQTFLRQSSLPSAPAATTLLRNHAARSSQQAAVHRLFNLNRFFSDKTAAAPSSPPPPPPPTEEGEKSAAAAEEDAAPKPPAEEDAASAEAAGDEAESVAPEVSREEQLEVELKAAKDQLLRSWAEQENTRRIAKRDVQGARNFAVKSFAKSLLDVSDNLARALDVVPEELRKDTEKNATLATLYEGIEMTEKGLVKAFEMNGLKKFGTPGELFDPNQHEALYEYPDAEKTPGTVGQVIKAGYMLNDRVLRPAEVGVVKKE